MKGKICVLVVLALAVTVTAQFGSGRQTEQYGGGRHHNQSGRPNYGGGRQQDRTRLRFKVSARNLKDKDNFGTTDPYVMIYSTENDGTSERNVGRSETISNTKNPDWSSIFDFNFERFKRQRWHFVVYDNDRMRRDDKVGEGWATVADFVDRGEYLQVNLNKKGFLILKKA